MALQNAAFDSEWNFPFIFGKRGGSACEHLKPQRAEELSRDRRAFHPRGAAQIQPGQAMLDLLTPWAAAGPWHSSHRRHLRSQAAW